MVGGWAFVCLLVLVCLFLWLVGLLCFLSPSLVLQRKSGDCVLPGNTFFWDPDRCVN